MNHYRSNDSELSLDGDALIGDDSAMISQPYQLYIERTEPSKNMARYYAMAIEPTLFGDACLTRRWGRIGTGGQQMVHHFQSEEEAVRLFLEVLRRKRARGYKPAGRSRVEQETGGASKLASDGLSGHSTCYARRNERGGFGTEGRIGMKPGPIDMMATGTLAPAAFTPRTT